MAALTEGTDYEIVGVQRGDVYNEIVIKTINTADAADTLTVDLTKYGIKADGLLGVVGFKHTTDNSVMVQEQPTTAVSSGTLTLTVPAGTDDDARFYLVKGISETAGAATL
ncbi:hypothetical protein GQ473_01800 [archaeon]|nr:hypothetical protein [archaeon]